MKNRSNRLVIITQIVGTQNISSQKQFLRMLNEEGFSCTQATLSRDLKFLKVGKVVNPNGKYSYKIYTDKTNSKINDSSPSFVSNGFVSLEFAQKLVVIKTVPAYASSLAMTIDMAEPYEIAGTIAGDDTILIIPRDGTTENDIRHRLILIFPELEDRIRRYH